METIKYGKHKVYTTTIPKGTLLFRAVEDNKNDFTGVQLDNKKCIPPQFNVFFYFNPFVVDSIHWYDFIKTMDIYQLNNDVKVVVLLKPSTHTRGDARTKKNPFMIPCNKTRKACIVGREYDPCFRDTFLKKHPEVMGYIGLARTDSKQLRDGLKKNLKDVMKYVQLAEDERNFKGSPELVLYPLQQRSHDDIYIDDPEGWKQNQQYNYTLVKTLPRKRQELVKFLESHTVQDPETGYFTYKE